MSHNSRNILIIATYYSQIIFNLLKEGWASPTATWCYPNNANTSGLIVCKVLNDFDTDSVINFTHKYIMIQKLILQLFKHFLHDQYKRCAYTIENNILNDVIMLQYYQYPKHCVYR